MLFEIERKEVNQKSQGHDSHDESPNHFCPPANPKRPGRDLGKKGRNQKNPRAHSVGSAQGRSIGYVGSNQEVVKIDAWSIKKHKDALYREIRMQTKSSRCGELSRRVARTTWESLGVTCEDRKHASEEATECLAEKRALLDAERRAGDLRESRPLR
jgi:hypothetical protein